MRRVGQARRRDDNEREIVDGLRKCGVFVVQISGLNAPDILCAFGSKWMPFEIKTAKGKLTKAQVQQQAGRAPYPVIKSCDDALKILLAR